MSYSLSQSPLHSSFLGDEAVASLFSAEADLAACVSFEIALTSAQAQLGLIPSTAAKAIAVALADFIATPSDYAVAMARDGVVVPALVADLCKVVGATHAAHLHIGATSQDVVDTSLMLRAAVAMTKIAASLAVAQNELKVANSAFGKRPLMGRTRMQQALEIEVSDRLGVWAAGLAAAQAQVKALRFPLQLGGPVGLNKNRKLIRLLAEALGLDYLTHCWQTERSPIIALGNACAQISGACGKIGQDVAMMVQNEIAEIKLKGGGTSSAMAHKQNPVTAETLVALARFNAGLISALYQSLVHEQERSGAAWTLEWMVLPQMIVTAAASARVTATLLASIEGLGK